MKPATLFVCCLLAVPGNAPGQVPRGRARIARPVDRAELRVPLASWPAVRNQYGYAGPEDGRYVLEATSNTWMGPGRLMPLNTALRSDFSVAVVFSVVFRQDCSLNIVLADTGFEYSELDTYLDLWQSGVPTYSAYEYLVQRGYATLKRSFAERIPVHALSAVDWRRVNTLLIERQGNRVSLSLNGTSFASFLAPVFRVSQMGVGVAFRSKVALSSVTVRQ